MVAALMSLLLSQSSLVVAVEKKAEVAWPRYDTSPRG